MLNKFAVVPEHFILATSAWKEQTHLLEEEDLAATRACIEGYHDFAISGANAKEESEKKKKKDYGELFAFFNSGEHSGASQPHRHVQLLPVERMRDGLEEMEASSGSTDGTRTAARHQWGVLADRLTTDDDGASAAVKGLPFRTFAERIHPGIPARELHDIYLRLYRRACAAVRRATNGQLDEAEYEQQTEGEAKISYNMAMTRNVLVIMPRLAEGAVITAPPHPSSNSNNNKGEGEGEERVIGKLALNGTVLAGTALVKSQAEWDFLRAHPEVVVDLLGRIGVSPSTSMSSPKSKSKV